MTNQTNRYDPLTSENAALVLVDHQVDLMTGVRDYSTGELKHNVVAIARVREINAARIAISASKGWMSVVSKGGPQNPTNA